MLISTSTNTGFNFISDGTYKSTGNARLNAGSLELSAQPYMLLTNPNNRNMSDNDSGDPIHYASQSVSQGGMVNANSGSRITVPVAGSYLVTACVSGEVQTHSHGDGIRIEINRDGAAYPSVDSYPIATTGSENGQEYCLMFTMILDLWKE